LRFFGVPLNMELDLRLNASCCNPLPPPSNAEAAPGFWKFPLLICRLFNAAARTGFVRADCDDDDVVLDSVGELSAAIAGAREGEAAVAIAFALLRECWLL
jgi:hypothetical protein